MANAYPVFGQWVNTRMTLRQSVVERFASNGVLRLRVLHATPKYDITVQHGFLTDDDCRTLQTFYTDNQTTTFVFTAQEDGVQRVCRFAAMPYQLQATAGLPGTHQATVYLREA